MKLMFSFQTLYRPNYMNTAERVVESYFRICKSCFTIPDVKVPLGNNRQLDLLAYNLHSGSQYHIEIGVTHCERWAPALEKLFAKFDHKFLGFPRQKDGDNTDSSRGKKYLAAIRKAYRLVGFSPDNVKRVWISWKLPEELDSKKQLLNYCRKRKLGPNLIEIISFRDTVIQDLLKYVGTANYEDDVLRTLSLLRQGDLQIKRTLEKTRQGKFVRRP